MLVTELSIEQITGIPQCVITEINYKGKQEFDDSLESQPAFELSVLMVTLISKDPKQSKFYEIGDTENVLMLMVNVVEPLDLLSSSTRSSSFSFSICLVTLDLNSHQLNTVKLNTQAVIKTASEILPEEERVTDSLW